MASQQDIVRRVGALDWQRLSTDLDAQGCTAIEGLISPADCEVLAGLYSNADRFRSRVVMSRHGFGRGEYKYFTYPLPRMIAALRASLYRQLAPIANQWNSALRIPVHYPAIHAEFTRRAKRVRHHYYFSTVSVITIVCTRICTVSTYSRCKSPFCCPHPAAISPVANSS